MTYALLALCVLAAVAAASAALHRSGRTDKPALAITIVALLVLTAVFDTIMIGIGFFHYADEHLLGIRIGLAPLEDFAYPVAGALLLPALWAVLRRRRSRRKDGPDA